MVGRGRLARDEQSDHLTLALEDEECNTMQLLQGHSITYRIAMGPHAGRKVFTLQTIPAWEEDDFGTDQLGRIGGFSLHAGVAVNTRCLLYTSPSPRDKRQSRMPSSA